MEQVRHQRFLVLVRLGPVFVQIQRESKEIPICRLTNRNVGDVVCDDSRLDRNGSCFSTLIECWILVLLVAQVFPLTWVKYLGDPPQLICLRLIRIELLESSKVMLTSITQVLTATRSPS